MSCLLWHDWYVHIPTDSFLWEGQQAGLTSMYVEVQISLPSHNTPGRAHKCMFFVFWAVKKSEDLSSSGEKTVNGRGHTKCCFPTWWSANTYPQCDIFEQAADQSRGVHYLASTQYRPDPPPWLLPMGFFEKLGLHSMNAFNTELEGSNTNSDSMKKNFIICSLEWCVLNVCMPSTFLAMNLFNHSHPLYSPQYKNTAVYQKLILSSWIRQITYCEPSLSWSHQFYEFLHTVYTRCL